MPQMSAEEQRRTYENERARTEYGEPPKRGPINRVIVFGIILFIIIACVSTVVSLNHQSHLRTKELHDALELALSKDQRMTEAILNLELDTTKMTFNEIFQRYSQSVADRTTLIDQVRGFYPEVNDPLKSDLAGYFSAENGFVEAKRDLFRKSIELSLDMDLFREQVKERPDSPYRQEFLRERTRQLKEKALAAAGDAEKSATDFLVLYDKMLKQEGGMSQEAHNAGLRFESIFQKHAIGNQKTAHAVEESAQQVANILPPAEPSPASASRRTGRPR